MASDTRERILNTAERLFAEHGYTATSLRSIIAEAKVNLAAVHYYFRSKEALLEAVILRRAEPINRERLEMLERYEREAGNRAVPLEKVIEAFLVPTLGLARDYASGGAVFVRLMGRIHAEGDILPPIIMNHFGAVLIRFYGALRRALPDLPDEDLFWRLHFALGALAQALKGSGQLEVVSGGLCNLSDTDAVLRHLGAFLSAAFRAPAVRAAVEEKVS